MQKHPILITLLVCGTAMISLLIIMAVMLTLTSCCTLNMSNVFTDGTASDVIDDTDTITSNPDISPTLSIPLK